MVILHDGIKTIQIKVFVFFLREEQKPLSFQKNHKTRDLKNKKRVNCFF